VDAAVRAILREWRPTFVDVMQERQRIHPIQLAQMDEAASMSAMQQATGGRLSRASSIGGSTAASRFRSRAAPQLTQRQKDEKLLAKIRTALKQAQQESSKLEGDHAQRRAEALVYTLTRLQNLSGSNFDAAPQRGILSVLETAASKPTTAQVEANVEKEHELADEAHKQQQIQKLKLHHAKKAEEERQAQLEAKWQEDEDAKQYQARQLGRPSASSSRRGSASSAFDHSGFMAPTHRLVDIDPDEVDEDEVVHHMGVGEAAAASHVHPSPALGPTSSRARSRSSSIASSHSSTLDDDANTASGTDELRSDYIAMDGNNKRRERMTSL